MINEDDRNKFLIAWKRSSAAQLLLPDPETSIIELGKEGGFLTSIAFIAHERGLLDRLDGIIEKWQIISRGTNGFKGKLKENWLCKEESRRRNVGNDTLSALSELIVASYLDNNGFKVIDLAAWGNNKADIICGYQNQKVFFEVKYFSDSPELYNQRVSAAKVNGVAVGSIPNRLTRLNYFYYRLAEAIIQLNNIKVAPKYKKVFFVFSELADRPRYEFENSIGNYKNWHQDNNGNCPGVLEKNKQTILNEKPLQWINQISELFIGTISNWNLENITMLLQPTAKCCG